MIVNCFRNKKFSILWSAGFMTGVSRAMEFLALSLFILEELGFPFLITIIFATRMLPMSLLGIFIGSISEKINPTLVVLFIYSCSTLACLACLLLSMNNNFNIIFALILAFINGVTWVVDLAVRRRMITENIDPILLSASLALETLSNNATRLLGPLLTGFLFLAVGLEGIFLILFFFYITALILIISFNKNYNIAFYNEDFLLKNITKNFFSNIKQVLVSGYKNAKLRLLLLVTLVFNFFGFPLISLVPVYGKNELNLSELDIGILASSEGLGALIGSLIIAKFSPQKNLSILFISGCIGFFVGMLFFSFSQNLLIGFLTLTFGGIFLSGFSTMQGAITYKSSYKGNRGYNFGILVTCIGLAPFGLIYLSVIITFFDVENLIRTNTVLALSLLLTLFVFIFKKRFVIY